MKKYTYSNSIVDKIVDGDTVHLTVDLGFDTWKKVNVRLGRINAPEMKGKTYAKGLESKNFLTNLIPVGSSVKFECLGKDKYGRWVGILYLEDERCVNDIMIENNMAIAYME